MIYSKIVDIFKRNKQNIYFRYILSFFCGLILSIVLNDIPFIADRIEYVIMSLHLDELLTFLTAGLLRLLGYPTEVTNGQIYIGTSSFYFAYGCLGIRHIALFAGFILTYFGSIRNKLIYIVFGCFILIIANVLRAVLIGIALYYDPTWFDFVHYYGSMIILYSTIFILWVVWSKIQILKNKHDAPKR